MNKLTKEDSLTLFNRRITFEDYCAYNKLVFENKVSYSPFLSLSEDEPNFTFNDIAFQNFLTMFNEYGFLITSYQLMENGIHDDTKYINYPYIVGYMHKDLAKKVFDELKI